MGEVDLSTVLDRIKSTSVKERTGGLDALREILNHIRRSLRTDLLNDRVFHQIFETLFHFSSVERKTYLEPARANVRQQSGKRLGACASTLRLAVEVGVTRIQGKSVRALLDHVVETLPVPEEGYCEPLISDYLKALRKLLEHPAHVEHLSQDLWEKVVTFCATGLEHADNESGAKASFASYGKTASGNEDGSAHRSSNTSAKISSGIAGKHLLPSRDTVEIVASLKQLTSAPNAPIQLQCDAIVHAALLFLTSTGEKGPLSKSTTAHRDAFATINSVLARTRNDKRELMLNALPQIIPLVREAWASKESALKQEILICLIYALDHISLLLDTEDEFSELDIENLVDKLYEEYSRRPERDSLNQLQCCNLAFSQRIPGQSDAFRTGNFQLRTGSTRSEMQWSTVQLIAQLSAGRDDRLRKQQAKQTNGQHSGRVQQRPKMSQSLHDFLRRTDVPKIQLRLASLQVVVFRVSQKAISNDEVQSVMERLLTLASDEDSEISSWAMVGLSSCASLEIASTSDLALAWITAWQVATRQLTATATCRAACHLAESILRLKLITHGTSAPSIDAIVTETDLYGPALLTDTSSTLLTFVIKMRLSESSSSFSIASERILQWLQGKWMPCNFGNRSYASEAAQNASARDVLRVIYACTDRPWKDNVQTEDGVLGSVCQAWLHRHNQQRLTAYLLNQDGDDFKDNVSLGLSVEHNDSHDSEGNVRLSSLGKDIALLDFCNSQLAYAMDALTVYSAKPQDANADMLRLLTNLCLVGTDLSCVDDFQDMRRHDRLIQQTQTLSNIVTGLVMRPGFDESNVEIMMEVVAAYAPPVSAVVAANIPRRMVRSVCKFAKIFSSSLEDRRQFGTGDALEDDIDVMDIDSGMESQMSHFNLRPEHMITRRKEIATRNDVQSMQSSTAMSMHFFASLEEVAEHTNSYYISSGFMDHLLSVSQPELLACSRVLLSALEAGASVAVHDADRLLEHLGKAYLASYEYERCEVALIFCLDIMMNLISIWIDPLNEDVFDGAYDIYGWFIKQALPAKLLSPSCQVKLADLLVKLMGLNADYGAAENGSVDQESNSPSVRTTLFSILKSGEIPVKNHIIASIPDVFNLFVLATHEGIFADVHANLPDDLAWVEGMAIRLLAYALLAARWSTLLRRCVYHVVEVAGASSSSINHARSCISRVTRALSLEDPRALFKLFSAQLLFTWLAERSIEKIPFEVFKYSTLAELLQDNREEAAAQLLMRQKGEDLNSLAKLLNTTPSELVLNSIGKCAAYCLTTDLFERSSGSNEKNVRESSLRSVIGGRDVLLKSFHEYLPKILGQLFLSMHQESDIAKTLQTRADLRPCFEILKHIREISSSNTALPPGQQPCFKSRIVLEAIDRLCRRVSVELSNVWNPPVLVYALRFLFDAIDPALGALHACNIIRKVRVVLCLAGDAALQGYALEMLLQTLRPFLTDHHCADDTFGIVQYLLTNGRSSLVDRPHFLASIALLILISLRSFLHSPQESTTQESQHIATMERARNFHKWFRSYLVDFPVDNVDGGLQSPFRAMLDAACRVQRIGNANKNSAESDLLRELLDDQSRSPSLVDQPTRDIALQMLCKDFEIPMKPDDELFAGDADAVAYSSSVLQLCQRLKVGRSFLLWSARLLGRAFASQGRFESYRQDQKSSLSPRKARETGLSKSKTAIIQALLDVFQSDRRQDVSFAEKTIRSVYMRFSQLRDPSEALAFEQLLPNHLHEVLNYFVPGDLDPRQSTLDSPRVQGVLRKASSKSLQTSTAMWIQTLTVELACAALNDAILGALPQILYHIEGLADYIFPYVLHEVLLLEKGKNEKVRHEMSLFCEEVFKQSSKDENANIRTLLKGLLYLRSQPVPAEDTPLSRDQWLDVDYLLASEAASKCGMYQTALLLAEIAAPREVARSRRSSAARPSVPSNLLLEIYTNIRDPDAFYGVEQQPSLNTVMMRAEHEEDGFKSLLYRGARLDSQLRRAMEVDAADYQGIMRALNRLNVNSITQSLAISQQVGSLHESIAMSLPDTARKLEQWDIRPPDEAKSPRGTLFKAFQTLNTSHDQILISSGLDSCFVQCMRDIISEASTDLPFQSALQSMAALAEINDVLKAGSTHSVREVWSTMQSRQRWMDLGQYEDASHIVSCRNTLFSSVSKNPRLQHMIPISLRDSRTIEIEALLASSRISRKHDVLQDSLSATTHTFNLISECRKCGIEVGAATTMELASVLWDQGEMASSIKLLKGLQNETHLERQDIPVSRALLLTQLGHHVAEARLEQPDEVIKAYLNPAVDALEGRLNNEFSGQVFHTFATFCEQQLQNPDGQEDFERVKSLREQKQNEVTQLSKILPQRSKDERHELKHAIKKAKQWYNIDNLEYERLKHSRNMLLGHSLENYLRALSQSDDYDTDVLRFFALWLENAGSTISNEAVERKLAEVPSWKFAVLMNQLSSRIQDEESKFQSLLHSLVLRICTEHPYHGMYHIYAGMKTPGGEDDSAISRNAAAKKIARLIERSRSRDLWRKICQTNDCFVMLACHPVEELMKAHGKRVSLKQVPAARTAGDVAAKAGVPPATMAIDLRPNGDYGDLPKIVKFDSSIQIAGGLSAPKILKAIGTDGKVYKQLYKGGNDELRQDAIMEQVFEEVSSLMRSHRETRRRNLRIRTYKVVPLGTTNDKRHSGIIEFVETISLHEFLIPAHKKYHPKDIPNDAARKKIGEVSGQSAEQRTQVYRQITKNFNPVMRFFFLERFKDPNEWFERRLAYTRSTAAISILGHVLGLGDRHLNNVLLDERSGEVVHIDLGVAFETGRVLPVPEVVPFRLTRDIVDGMGITGVEGVFRRCCEFMLDALRRDQSSIMTILNVLRYDPLYTWSVSPLKAKQMQDAHEEASNVAGASGANSKGVAEGRQESRSNDAGEADRALSVVQRKLNKTLSTTATVNELIQQATDERNLAVLFQGWCAWV
ncbi:MAG: Serine/threonine-protein kinase tel1 [Bathelium mastoideum]|nr:MAG: Serine/threonine-protein kinase tel1 [Bathelium mastoideum]